MVIGLSLQEKCKNSIEKFYFDACSHHEINLLSLTIDAGFHQLGEYLTVTTELGDEFHMDDSFTEPKIMFAIPKQERGELTTMKFEVKEVEYSTYLTYVYKLKDGSLMYNGTVYDNQRALVKALQKEIDGNEFFSASFESLNSTYHESSPEIVSCKIL